MADSISAVFVPIVVVIALLTFATWMIVGGDNATSMALTSTIAVLIIACPCALGLATPAAIIVGSGLAARHGILFTHAEALERLRDVTTIIVDKTGTLTSGTPRVHDAVVVSIDETELAPYVQAAERGSEHPLAFALLQWASARMQTSAAELSADDVTAVPGRGTVARFGDTRVRIGNAAFMEESMFLIPPALQQAGERFASQGWASIYVSLQRTVVACIAVADELRATSRDTVRALIDAGITVVMATGDHEAPARAIATQAGIATVLHSATPLEKHEEIRRRQALGECVAMVGDGINDAPALAQADVGIAIGSGTDIAKNTADITLMRADLAYVLTARRISQDTVRSIKQNLFFAFIYNVVGIPLAAGALYPGTGLEFSPMIAAAAMSLSSVTVLANALRQRLSTD
jgi:Cu+-exporting ATPase